MSNELAMTEQDTAVLEQLVVNGDMKALTPEQRVQYYRMRCDSAGLDWRTQPFSYITLQGKLTLYATKTATEQLCEKRKLSCEIVKDGMIGDLYKVQARATGEDGRHTDNIGVVTAGNLKGDALANAMMKAVTKSFRRAVLSHCGLGMLDETETETIPNATPVPVESAHKPAPQTIELATQADVDTYEAIRETAVEFGYRIKGNEPSHVTTDAPRERVLKGIAVMKKWLDGNTPEPSTEEEMNGDDGSTPARIPCDKEKYQKKFFAIAAGTAYVADAGRASFLRDFTNGKTGSLGDYLADATTPEAQALCTALQNQINADKAEFYGSDPFASEDEDTTLPLETTAAGTNTAHA